MTRSRQLELVWSEHEGDSCLQVQGWTDAELSELDRLAAADLVRRLAVLPSELVVVGASLGTIQPVAGHFEIDHDAVLFIPRFPFRDGLSYSLLVDSAPGEIGVEEPEVWSIQRPAPAVAPTTDVVAIYPSGDQLPVNQLKFYIHFSSPMSEGFTARAIQVRRADNHERLEGVFLLEPELWDPERRRLTLLLDPARIKRGLISNLEAGYPLNEGVPIILTIDTLFRDAVGQPLTTIAERRYEIGPTLRVRIDQTDWSCHPPTAGSTDPLIVEFDRPLDHALLEHSLWVNDAAGVVLAGRGSVGLDERSWEFEPQSPWGEGRHLVTVDPRLEDLAGNSLLRVFDRDIMRSEDAPADDGPVAIEFTCLPALTKPADAGV